MGSSVSLRSTRYFPTVFAGVAEISPLPFSVAQLLLTTAWNEKRRLGKPCSSTKGTTRTKHTGVSCQRGAPRAKAHFTRVIFARVARQLLIADIPLFIRNVCFLAARTLRSRHEILIAIAPLTQRATHKRPSAHNLPLVFRFRCKQKARLEGIVEESSTMLILEACVTLYLSARPIPLSWHL